MNAKCLLIAIIGAILLAQEGESFFLWNRFGRFGGLGLGGFGLGGFGRFGLGGFGRFGLGGFGGFGRFGFGGFGLRRFGFGKRETDENMTDCFIRTDTKTLVCSGKNSIECPVNYMLPAMEGYPFIFTDMSVVKVEDKPVFNLLAQKEIRKEVVIDDHTFLTPVGNKPVTISISAEPTTLGFTIVDKQCWADFSKIVKDCTPKTLSMEIFIDEIKDVTEKKVEMKEEIKQLEKITEELKKEVKDEKVLPVV